MTDVRQEMVDAADLFYHRGWMAGTAGNLSVRDPDDSGLVWITASGKPKGLLTVGDLVGVGLDGKVASSVGNPKGNRPSAETSIHLAIYEVLPQVAAVYHVHTVEANLLTALHGDSRIPLPKIEMLKGLGLRDESAGASIEVFENHLDVSQVAHEVAVSLRGTAPAIPGLLIRGHGLTAWGATPLDALHAVELLDFCFRYALAARSVGLS